jgi:hypothetical protein
VGSHGALVVGHCEKEKTLELLWCRVDGTDEKGDDLVARRDLISKENTTIAIWSGCALKRWAEHIRAYTKK